MPSLSLAEDINNLAMATGSPFYYKTPHFAEKKGGHFLPFYDNPHLSLDSRDMRSSPNQSAKLARSVGKDGFQVSLDVAHFKPNELNVKVVDQCIVVEGKHEEREDEYGYISRHFIRRYDIPKEFDSEKVASSLSSDGILTISIPKPNIQEKSQERIIQIQQVGPAFLNVKKNPMHESIVEDETDDKVYQ